MEEAFGREISKAYSDSKISGILVIENVPIMTHQQYADDTILSGESTTREALNFKSIIEQYMKLQDKE